MHSVPIGHLLTEEQVLLLQKIKEKSEEYGLPVVEGNERIGFGCFLDFYMFWIIAKRGRIYFHARKHFSKPRLHNTISLDFLPRNEDLLFEAINNIYQSYLFYKEDPDTYQKDFMKNYQAPVTSANAPPSRPKSPTEEAFLQSRWYEVKDAINERFDAYIKEGLPPVEPFEYDKKICRDIDFFFDEILDYLCALAKGPVPAYDVFRRYIEDDSATLALIGEQYGLTRERIRQLCAKGRKRLCTVFTWAIKKDEELHDCLNQLAEALLSLIGDPANAFLLLALPIFSKRKNAFFLEFFFGKNVADLHASFIKACIKAKETEKRAEANAPAWKSFEAFQAKICYPSDKEPAPLSLASYPKETSLLYVTRLRERLEGMSDHLRFVENPDIVYYTSTKTAHRPNFLLLTEDGKYVLVVIVSIQNLAIYYNVSRFKGLRDFCAENGYGYLILSDTGKTLEDIKGLAIDPALTEELDNMLTPERPLFWPDIEPLKERYKINPTILAAYILQNGLSFSRPFCIRKRRT